MACAREMGSFVVKNASRTRRVLQDHVGQPEAPGRKRWRVRQTHFKETSRPYFVKGASYTCGASCISIVFWQTSATDFITWITRFEVGVRSLTFSWIDRQTRDRLDGTDRLSTSTLRSRSKNILLNIPEQIVTERREILTETIVSCPGRTYQSPLSRPSGSQ